MADITKSVRHLPLIVQIQQLEFETVDGIERGNFVHLKLVGNDIWVQGTPIWHNRMRLPHCFLRNVVSGGIFEAGLTISHWHKTYRTWISLPNISNANVLESTKGPWNFLGFLQDRLVDIDFVKRDAERLRNKPNCDELHKSSYNRPDKGIIV